MKIVPFEALSHSVLSELKPSTKRHAWSPDSTTYYVTSALRISVMSTIQVWFRCVKTQRFRSQPICQSPWIGLNHEVYHFVNILFFDRLRKRKHKLTPKTSPAGSQNQSAWTKHHWRPYSSRTKSLTFHKKCLWRNATRWRTWRHATRASLCMSAPMVASCW